MNEAMQNSNTLRDHLLVQVVRIVVPSKDSEDFQRNVNWIIDRFSLRVGGPIWLGPLFDQTFVSELITSIEQAPADR